MSDDVSRGLRVATAALVTALFVIAYYAIDRTRAAIFVPGPDPATVMATERIEYFWRVLVCAYVSPLVFAGAWALTRGREQRAWRLVQVAVWPVAGIATLLAVVFP